MHHPGRKLTLRAISNRETSSTLRPPRESFNTIFPAEHLHLGFHAKRISKEALFAASTHLLGLESALQELGHNLLHIDRLDAIEVRGTRGRVLLLAE